MKKYFSVPNVISGFRLVLFPVLLYFASIHELKIFAWLFLISLLSDIADGFIARRFNMVTEFGSKLDSWGDFGNYIAALAGIVFLCMKDVKEHAFSFIVLFSLYFLGTILMFIKFKKLIGLHLYSSKITGYVQGSFLITWFLFGFNEIFFYLAVVIGSYAFIEEIILILLLKKEAQNLKSLFWVIKHRRDLLESYE